jgi:hypothetical protein
VRATLLSAEGELLYTLVGQRDSVLRRAQSEGVKPQVKVKRNKVFSGGEVSGRAGRGPIIHSCNVLGLYTSVVHCLFCSCILPGNSRRHRITDEAGTRVSE